MEDGDAISASAGKASGIPSNSLQWQLSMRAMS
jgi:hypothetical protein